ncbi:DUF2934 domain-containing protein [Metapseudomonas otitidis]|uniref:DUF2934 domain-containing protein n=1 Tax=Metapseudomonas otitidis TaxID=319939 RepID=UPI003672491D
MNTDDQRVRELAYQIWESEGRPHGQDARHWEMARKLAQREKPRDTPPEPTSRPASKPRAVDTSSGPVTPTRRPRAAKPAASEAEENPALLKKPRAPRTPKTPKA